MIEENKKLIVLGWREWVSLPRLVVPAIKAKIDTGARTSAIHTCRIERFKKDSIDYVRFFLHPLQGNNDLCLERTAPIIDRRTVSDSGGHKEKRYIIKTDISVGNSTWPIEITLTNRDNMRFRMLLGRTAMHNMAIVNPALSFVCGRMQAKELYATKPQETE